MWPCTTCRVTEPRPCLLNRARGHALGARRFRRRRLGRFILGEAGTVLVLGIHLYRGAEPGEQRMVAIGVFDLHAHGEPLHDLDPVAGGVLRGQHRELRAGAATGIAMAWVAFAAAGFDYVENLGLDVSLWGQPASPWPELARVAALLKFGAIGLALVFGLSGIVAALIRLRRERAA